MLFGVVPLTFWLLLQVGGGAESTGGALWLAALVVGGLTPAVARRMAMRNPPDEVASRPNETGDRT